LYSSPNINRVIKSRTRWGGHVACMTEMRNVYNKILVEKPERDHLGDLGTDGRIILRRILKK
jgi:hypothetical protein